MEGSVVKRPVVMAMAMLLLVMAPSVMGFEPNPFICMELCHPSCKKDGNFPYCLRYGLVNCLGLKEPLDAPHKCEIDCDVSECSKFDPTVATDDDPLLACLIECRKKCKSW